jgi:Carbohydrate-binding module family 5/12
MRFMRRNTIYVVGLVGALLPLSILPRVAEAQFTTGQVDSLVALLDSPDWQVRSDALAALTSVPHAQLPPSYGPKVISLMNQEALNPIQESTAPDEALGDYEMNLVGQALSFRDPAALPGFAYLGIQMAGAVKAFVAENGSTALPYLQGAWTQRPTARPAIMTTWALMVGPYRSQITPAERIGLLAALLGAADSEPIGFVSAALRAPLAAAMPVVQAIATADSLEIVRSYAQDAIAPLTAHRDSLSPAQLHADLTDWLQAICLNATGAKATACATLTTLLAAGPSNGGALEKVQATADFAFQDGTLTPFEHALLAANADSLLHVVLVAVPAWARGVHYAVGDSASYNGLYYQCRQAHTAQIGWEPPKVYALWFRIAAGETWAPQVMYSVGDQVIYQGVRYRAIQAHQSQPGWAPPNVPALWARVQ